MLEADVRTTELPGFVGVSPLEVLRAVAARSEDGYVLLHSGSGGTSVLGFDELTSVTVDGRGRVSVGVLKGPEGPARRTGEPQRAPQPLAALEAAVGSLRFAQPHPLVGWMGFVSYDVARFLENIAERTEDELQWPILSFTLFRHYLVLEEGAVTGVTLGDREMDWESLLAQRFGRGAAAVRTPPVLLKRQMPGEYLRKVEQVKAYIAAGDIYQANLAQAWEFDAGSVVGDLRPHETFIRLCEISPAPFAACMRLSCAPGMPVRHVVSASPEMFLTVREEDGIRVAQTRPIKGTRPRDLADAVRDAALRDELLASEKDRAELNMIVDLLRNDLGRVSEFGSVRVIEPRAMERHPTVWHTVATIESRLRADAGLAEILAGLCPGGSITGAPKIRAMQILEELEGFRRGLYCGNIGVIGDGGRNMALNIAIRTILFQDGRAHVYAGGGIVADSEPMREYEETLHKARAMLEALGMKLHHEA